MTALTSLVRVVFVTRVPMGSSLLRAWRDGLGLTQIQAAKLLDMDFVQYSKHETGRRRPGLRRALLIERVTKGKVPCKSWMDAAPRRVLEARS